MGNDPLEVRAQHGRLVDARIGESLASDLDLVLSFERLTSYLSGCIDVYELLDGGVEISGELDDLELVIGLIESKGARHRYRSAMTGLGPQVAALGTLLADSGARALIGHDLRSGHAR